jgi:uncharacterized sporulation protein YeaH/YhbH (DUF444 family)
MGVGNIKQDLGRFKQIVRGQVRKNLKKYITNGEMIARRGKEAVAIPLPSIDIPRFKFGQNSEGGVGQGDGEVGDPVGGQPQPGDGQGEAGKDPGEHALEAELTLEELAELLGEELELPKIEPKGDRSLKSLRARYSGIASTGPDSLKHIKRSFKQTIKRAVAAGEYDPDDPVLIPIRDDLKYRAAKVRDRMENNAVIIYMMDVSGSMGDEQKEIVRTESFWIDTWIRSQYKGVETRYIIHDAAAKEVDEDTFFRTRESGGTLISSAYKLCEGIIRKDYNPEQWNIYPFHFSDGDNWSGEDTRLCMDVLESFILPASNVFCYGQVESRYGSGQFYKDLQNHFGESHEDVILSRIENREGILNSIKDFLGKGK